jgi:hypothetical protein
MRRRWRNDCAAALSTSAMACRFIPNSKGERCLLVSATVHSPFHMSSRQRRHCSLDAPTRALAGGQRLHTSPTAPVTDLGTKSPVVLQTCPDTR